jgi:hypothetical protein
MENKLTQSKKEFQNFIKEWLKELEGSVQDTEKYVMKRLEKDKMKIAVLKEFLKV